MPRWYSKLCNLVRLCKSPSSAQLESRLRLPPVSSSMATIDYMINSYGPYSASATGGNGFARDFLAGVAAFYSHPMYENIGDKYHLEWPSTILAILAVFVTIPVYVSTSCHYQSDFSDLFDLQVRNLYPWPQDSSSISIRNVARQQQKRQTKYEQDYVGSTGNQRKTQPSSTSLNQQLKS